MFCKVFPHIQGKYDITKRVLFLHPVFMPLKLIFSIVTVFLFGICGWCGSVAFLYQGSEWILGISNPSLRTVLFHDNALRSLALACLWGVLNIIPLYYIHGKKIQPIVSLFYLPISTIVLCSGYLYFWPPDREMELIKSLEILLAEGWKVFSISYIFWLFIPLSVWSHIEKKRLQAIS